MLIQSDGWFQRTLSWKPVYEYGDARENDIEYCYEYCKWLRQDNLSYERLIKIFYNKRWDTKYKYRSLFIKNNTSAAQLSLLLHNFRQ